MTTRIYQKTEKGQDEIRTRANHTSTSVTARCS
jgi:hypothetical protein